MRTEKARAEPVASTRRRAAAPSALAPTYTRGLEVWAGEASMRARAGRGGSALLREEGHEGRVGGGEGFEVVVGREPMRRGAAIGDGDPLRVEREQGDQVALEHRWRGRSKRGWGEEERGQTEHEYRGAQSKQTQKKTSVDVLQAAPL